jgi:hypothetical protein
MINLPRREAFRAVAALGAGSVAPLLASTSAPSVTIGKTPSMAWLEATVEPSPGEGRRLTRFIETGQLGGCVLCTLTRQDPGNPAVISVSAASAVKEGRRGADITVQFLGEPRGSLTLSVVHFGEGPNAVEA